MEHLGLARPHLLRRAAAATVALVFWGALGGCGLFDPREPEGEGGGSQVPFRIPGEPRIALENLEAAAAGKAVGNFERSFTARTSEAEKYRFKFDVSDAQSDTIWFLERDIQALTRLLQNQGTVSLAWTVRDSGNTGQDFFYRNLGYRLVFRRSAGDSSLYAGTCFLYFRQEGVSWLIYRWVDLRESAGDSTWGYARLHPALP